MVCGVVKPKLPKNICTVKQTGKYFFRVRSGQTRLLGPQRQTVPQAVQDIEFVLGDYLHRPHQLRKNTSDLAAAIQRNEDIRRRFRSEELGIQKRFGVYIIRHYGKGSTRMAVRFTHEQAVEARLGFMDNTEVPSTPVDMSTHRHQTSILRLLRGTEYLQNAYRPLHSLARSADEGRTLRIVSTPIEEAIDDEAAILADGYETCLEDEDAMIAED